MVVSDLTQDWWSVLVSSVKKGWDILHKQDPVCLEHEQWQSCVKTCGAETDWSGLQLHFILHCCSVSMQHLQHQGAAVTMLQSVNTAGIITGCRLRLMMAALGSPERYCQAHDNIWEERMARSKSWRWTWMRVGSKDFFCPGTIFWFWVPYEWPGMVSLSDIAARRLSRGTAVRTFYCCSAAGCKADAAAFIIEPRKEIRGRTARYFYQCPSRDGFFSTWI